MSITSFGISSFTDEYIHSRVLSLLDSEERGRTLDAGAGTGALTARLRDEGFDVEACDIFPENFLPKDILVKEANLNSHLPYEADLFDCVVSAEVIEHLENPWLFIRELHRVTKEGATVVLSTPNMHNWYVRGYFFLTSKLYYFLSSYEKIGHITPVSLWNLERMIEGRFTLEEVCTSRSVIPQLNIPLPFKGLFWGECIVVKLKRLGKVDVPSRVWYEPARQRR